MEYNNEKLLAMFRKEHPEYMLDEIDLREVIQAPWRFIRDEMDGEERNLIRLPFFGTFRPINRKSDGQSNPK